MYTRELCFLSSLFSLTLPQICINPYKKINVSCHFIFISILILVILVVICFACNAFLN